MTDRPEQTAPRMLSELDAVYTERAVLKHLPAHALALALLAALKTERGT